MQQVACGAAIVAATGVGGGLVLLTAEMLAARWRRYVLPDPHLPASATVGRPSGPPLRLVLLGDATALGVGAGQIAETVGGQLSALLNTGPAGRPVELRSVAAARARAENLALQVARVLVGPPPDVAVIVVGIDDALHPTSLARAAAHLGAAVRRLRMAGISVVVGTCPDIGALWALARPLRHLLYLRGRKLARVQAAAVRAEGGVAVDLGAQTGTVFRADPGTLCHDGFHPSPDGYRVLAHALLPAVENAMPQAHPPA